METFLSYILTNKRKHCSCLVCTNYHFVLFSPTPEPEPEAPQSPEEQKAVEAPLAAEAQKESEAQLQSGRAGYHLNVMNIGVDLVTVVLKHCCSNILEVLSVHRRLIKGSGHDCSKVR